MAKKAGPFRGEVCHADLSPARGHEQDKVRPVLVISNDAFNAGEADLVTVVPITETDRGIPLHVRLKPPDGGLRRQSFIQCEQIRTIAKSRIKKRLKRVSRDTMDLVDDSLMIHLDL